MRRFALLACAFLMACGDDNPTNGGGGGNSLTATVSGAQYTSTLAIQAVRSGNVLSIGGSDAAGKGINITIVGLTAPGTINLTANSSTVAQYHELANAWTTSLSGGTGTITVTTLTDHQVTGTFSFTGIAVAPTTGTRVVTNGSFNISF